MTRVLVVILLASGVARADKPAHAPPADAEQRPSSPPAPHSSRRTIALVVGGAGVVVSGVGFYFGARAYADWNASRKYCDDNNRCLVAGRNLIDASRSAAVKADILVGGGLAVLAVATYLFVTAPHTSTGTVTAMPVITPTLAGGVVSVGF